MLGLENTLPIQVIHSFLVHPLKGIEPRRARGTSVRQEGQLYGLLNGVYERASTDCDVEICFRPDEDGRQNNFCRTMLTDYVEHPTIAKAREIASRLESVTDRRSGLGLLFLICGFEGNTRKLLLSRFPTDEGVSADESADGLNVQYLERVFMKNKFSYKAVVYQDRSIRSGFWIGRAIDRQNSDQGTSFSSNFWIADFLSSELSITAAAGSRRLGIALRDALKHSDDPPVRRELVAAATLATGLRGQNVSISSLADRFNLSDKARAALEGELKSPAASSQRFRLDDTEFNAVVGLLSVELNNGGVMTAPSAQFDQVFTRRQVQGSPETEFKTRGTIIGEKLKRSS